MAALSLQDAFLWMVEPRPSGGCCSCCWPCNSFARRSAVRRPEHAATEVGSVPNGGVARWMSRPASGQDAMLWKRVSLRADRRFYQARGAPGHDPALGRDPPDQRGGRMALEVDQRTVPAGLQG